MPNPFSATRVLRLVFWVLLGFFFSLTGFLFNLSYNPAAARHPLTAYEYYRQAKTLVDKKQYSKAEELLLKSLALDPSHYKAMIELGCLYSAQAEFINARGWYEKALALTGNDKVNLEIALYDLGKSYENEHDTDKAWEFLRRAYAMKKALGNKEWPDDPAYPEYYVLTNNRKKFEQQVKDFYPIEISHRDNQLRRWVYFGKTDKILKDCSGYLARNPNTRYKDVFLRWQVWAALQLKDYKQALAYLEALDRCVLKDKDKAWAMKMRYEVHLYKKEYGKAIGMLDAMAKVYPKHISAVWCKSEMAFIYREKGDIESEKRVYTQMVEIYANSHYTTQARLRLVEILTAQGDYAQAYRYLMGGFSFPRELGNIVGLLMLSGFLVFLLFVFSRLFFIKKLQLIKDSGMRLRHLWLVVFIFLLFGAYSLFVFFQLNQYTGNALGKMHFDPLLMSSIFYELVMAFICARWLMERYGWDRWKIGLFSRGVIANFAVPLAVAVGLVAAAIVWDTFLKQVMHVHFTPKHPMDNFIQDVFVRGFWIPKILMVMVLAILVCGWRSVLV